MIVHIYRRADGFAVVIEAAARIAYEELTAVEAAAVVLGVTSLIAASGKAAHIVDHSGEIDLRK
jgi:hypothetical protein